MGVAYAVRKAVVGLVEARPRARLRVQIGRAPAAEDAALRVDISKQLPQLRGASLDQEVRLICLPGTLVGAARHVAGVAAHEPAGSKRQRGGARDLDVFAGAGGRAAALVGFIFEE